MASALWGRRHLLYPQVMVLNLTGFSHGPGSPIGSVQDNQLWGADWGVLR